MQKKPTLFYTPLFFSLIIHFLFLFYFPYIKINFFVPFLVYVLIFIPHKTTQSAILIGLILDLSNTNLFLGGNVLIWVSSAFVIIHFKKILAHDSFTIIPFGIFYSSIILTIIELILKIITGRHVDISSKWFWLDIIFMPTLDLLYGSFLFIPFIKFIQTKKQPFKKLRPQ